jgi:hypothetical protein
LGHEHLHNLVSLNNPSSVHWELEDARHFRYYNPESSGEDGISDNDSSYVPDSSSEEENSDELSNFSPCGSIEDDFDELNCKDQKSASRLDMNKTHIIYDINSNNEECLNDEDELQPWTAENVTKVVNEIQKSDSNPEDVVVTESVGYLEDYFEISNCSLPEMQKFREKPLTVDECLYDKNIPNIYIKAFKKRQ